MLTRLLDKCKEDGCMNMKEYQNSKEKYFKYCLKRTLCLWTYKWGAVLTKRQTNVSRWNVRT